MEQYLCLPCGFIYNENQRDFSCKQFSELPINWVCPDCGAAKFDFELIVEQKND
ncbi:MAG: rubredoxin [Proteobacteria bacterium]|nr:rubredoxin [Pseudomonadota bacterium]